MRERATEAPASQATTSKARRGASPAGCGHLATSRGVLRKVRRRAARGVRTRPARCIVRACPPDGRPDSPRIARCIVRARPPRPERCRTRLTPRTAMARRGASQTGESGRPAGEAYPCAYGEPDGRPDSSRIARCIIRACTPARCIVRACPLMGRCG